MERDRILILGAGAAGLAAAEGLSQAGLPVTMLEARARCGGRIYTRKSAGGELPIELGAEFIHGAKASSWECIRAAALPVHEVPEEHWRFTQGKLEREQGFWDELAKLIPDVNEAVPDQDFQSYLEGASGLSASVKQLAKDFVEGFHAAAANRIGIRALATAEAASERDQAERQFRITAGYAALVDWFLQRLAQRPVAIHLNTVVQAVRWQPGRVEVLAQTPEGARRFEAARALITLPLGVLQATGAGAVRFEPELVEKHSAIHGLAMGRVVKLVLQFRARFWPVENFGFIHAPAENLPTWWSDERGPLLTGWTGGPRAERLKGQSPEELLRRALETLARLFGQEPRQVRELLVAHYGHDWGNDPFARGAYSYTPAGMIEMPERLGAPLADTLFFAGEATDATGEQGTVHGALASGQRAAGEMVQSMTVRAASAH